MLGGDPSRLPTNKAQQHLHPPGSVALRRRLASGNRCSGHANEPTMDGCDIGKTVRNHLQRVAPTGPVGCVTVAMGAPEAQAAKRQWQTDNVPSLSWDSVFASQTRLHEVWVPQRSPEDDDPLNLSGKVVVAFPNYCVRVLSACCPLQDLDVSWHPVAPVSHLDFALVDLDPNVVPQLRPQQMMDVNHSLWSTHYVNVVKECDEVLIMGANFLAIQPKSRADPLQIKLALKGRRVRRLLLGQSRVSPTRHPTNTWRLSCRTGTRKGALSHIPRCRESPLTSISSI